MSPRSTTSSSRRRAARSRARATRPPSTSAARWAPRLELRRERRAARTALGGAHAAPTGEPRLLVRLPDDPARGEREWARRRHANPGFPGGLLPHLRARGPVRAGRALCREQRGHEHRDGHRERLPLASLPDATVARRAAHRAARRRGGARVRAGGRVPGGGGGRGRRLRGWAARRAGAARAVGDHHARIRHDRRLRRPSHRLGRGCAGPLPAHVRAPLPVVERAAAEPDRAGLVPHDRDLQPGLLPARGDPQPADNGLGRRGPGARLRLRDRDRRARGLGVLRRAPDEDAPHMSRASFKSVTLAVAARSIHNVFTNPALILPSLIFPLFFFTAFAGGLSRVGSIPGFDFPSGYTAFQFVFVLIQSSAFAGVFTGFGVARDFEMGFGRRLFLAAPRRGAIVTGYLVSGLVRALFTMTVITGVALATGMQVGGNGVDLFGLYGLAALVYLAASLWAVGVALRARSIQAGPLMQMPVFLALFLAPVYVPLDLLSGWIHSVASANPVTAFFEAGRDLISGQASELGLAVAIAAGLIALFGLWSVRSLRSAEAVGG